MSDLEPAPSLPEHALPPASRRELLGHVAIAATVGMLWLEGVPDPLRRQRMAARKPGDEPQNLTPLQARTLEAATDRILPSSDGSPGAKDVDAAGYLDAILAEPDIDADLRERIRKGADRLHAFAHEQGKEYAGLQPTLQDAGLEALKATWEDELSFRAILAFTLEAFLGDPRHGGNPDGIGWTWAEHEPGFPRPLDGWAPRGQGPRSKGDR